MTDQRNRISSVVRKSNQWLERTVRVLFILIFVFSGIGSVPLLNARAQALPLITVSGEMTAFSSAAGMTSAEQSYTVSAADLAADLVITAPQGFEISAVSGGDFASTLTLAPDETGSVAAATIYVRFSPTTAADFSDVIKHTSEGAEEVDQPVSASSVPLISVTGSLDAFSAAVGSVSEAQSYQVSGVNLSGDLLISAPEHFALALDPNGDFSDTLDLKPEKGVVSDTSIYVTFESDSAGTFDGKITHASDGAGDVDLDISANANFPRALLGASLLSTDVGIASTTCGTYSISQSSDDAVQSVSSNSMYLTYTTHETYSSTSSAYRWWGMRFQNITIPNGADITTAYLTFKAAATNANSGPTMTWNGNDVDSASTFTTTSKDISNRTLTTANVSETIPAWTSGTSYNTSDLSTIIEEIVTRSGWASGNSIALLGKASTTAQDKTAVAYDDTTQANEPSLYVCYSSSTPTVNVSVSNLTGFNAPVGGTSTEQSFTVSGSNLTDNITITPPSDTEVEISLTSGSGFVSYPSTLTIPYGSGTVSDTPIYVHLKPTSSTTYSSLTISNASTGATTVNVAVSGSSVPTITTTGTMSAFSAAVATYSSEQSYTVSALNLTSDLTITPPASFEISKTSGSGFVDSTGSLIYTPVSGVVSSQTNYVRFKNASAGTYTGNISHASGTASSSVSVSGTASAPTLTASGTLTFFNSTPGIYSSAQSFTVSGTYLSGNVIVTAPTGYVVSTTSGGTYTSSLTLTPSGSTLASTTVYVKLYSSTAGAASGDIAVTSSGATTANVSATGYVYAWRAFNDCNINTTSQTNPANTTKFACYSASSGNALKNFDTGSTNGALLTVAIGSGTLTYNTGTGVTPNSGTDAYNTFSGYANLIDVIKMDSSTSSVTLTISGLDPTKTYAFATSSDRNSSSYTYTTDYVISDIANTSITNASTSGVTLGTSSIAQDKSTFKSGYNTVTGYVARWTGIQTGSDGDFVVTYTTATSQGYGPQVFMLAEENDTTPKITLSASSLTGFASTPGTASAAQTVTVTGANLTSAISVTAPTGFIVSSDGSSYDSTATLPTSGGTLSVKMLSSAEGTPSGTITLSSSGATSKTIDVSGTVLYQYTLTVGTDGNGTVALSPSGGIYNHGQTVTLTPTGNTGYKFSDWSGDNSLDVVNTSGVYTIVMDGNKSLSANFAAKSVVTISTDVSPSGGGTVTVSPSSGPYYEGDSVMFTATANSGYAFSSWTGSSTATTNPLTLTLSGNVYLTAVFTVAEVCTTVNLEAIDDLYMSGANTTNNYGATTTLKVSYSTSYPRGDLLRWDLSSIPSNATISSATLSLYVSTNASATYYLYNMRRDWVEGTGNSSASKDGATWLTYDGANAWTGNGASDTSSDRYNTNLWNATSTSFATPTETKTVSLNSSGVEVVQGWVDGSISNYGLTMQNYGSSSTEYTMQYASAENTSNAGPTLNVTYCTGGSATHLLTVTNDGNGSVTLSPSATDNEYAEGTVVTLTTVPGSGYEFSNWTGTNADDVTGSGNTWTITMNTAKTLQANFTLIPVNVAPDAPVLTSPSDGATGTSLSPTLSAAVSDGNSDDLTVKFYGRKVGTSAGSDFTFVLVPDPQNLVTSTSAALTSQFNWIVNNASANNIVFVSTTGDLVNTATSTTEYSTIDSMFDLIDAAGIPYSVGPGNHDYPLSNYNTYFGTARFSGKSWYGGYYDSSNENNYSFFSASGNDFIVINLGYNPSSTILSWADSLLTTYSTKRAIVITHSLLNTDNSWTIQNIFTTLKGHSNLFLMLCGHMHSSTDGSAYRAETATDGHTVHIMMADYQDYSQGYLRILRFSPANDMIYGTTYSPYTGGYLTSTSNYEATSLAYDLANGSADAYTLIGTTTAASGTTASVSWSGLTSGTEYEWYATATDPDGETVSSASSFTFTTGSGTNTVPVLSAIGSKSGNELSAITFTASATDDGLPSGTLTYSLANGTSGTVPTGAAINSSTGAFSWTPTEAQGPGSYTFDVCVSDGSLSDCETITVTVAEVNTAPTITETDPQSMTVVEDIATTLTLHASDADGNTLTWSILTNGTHGTASVSTTPTGTSQVITYTPTLNSNTADSFVVQVSDGTLTDTITINVTITPVNDAPVFTESSPQAMTVTEDSSNTLTLHVTDVDTAAGSLTWSISTAASHGTASVSVTPTGLSQVITYSPNANYDSTDSFIVKVTDGTASIYLTVNVTITPVNDAPVFTESSPQAMTVTEDSSGTLTLHVTDVDTAAGSLTWSISTAASHGTASVSVTPTGLSQVITYSPNANYDSSDSFIVKMTDGTASIYLTVNVTVTPVNDAPVFTESSPQTMTVTEDSSNTLTLHVTDVDTAAGSLTWSISTLASHGTASVSGTPTGTSQVITYSPNANYDSTDTFIVKVTDGTANVYLTVNVTVTPVNDAPVFTESSPQTMTVTEDSSNTLTLHVTDVDTAAGSLIWSISTAASHGTASVSGTPTGLSQVITYSPNANSESTDTFIVKVSDGTASIYLTVNVTVTPVNDAPVITEGASTTVTMSVNGSPTAFSLTLNATDVDTSAASLTWSVKTAASHGTATAAGTGGSLAVSYVPTTDYVGSDSFEVQVSDGAGGTDSITINVNITANTGSQTISLVPGWNLISIKLVPSSTAIASVLSSISGNYDLVYTWDAASTSSDKWLIYDPSTGIGNTLTTLTNNQGFWVHMTAADDLVVTGTVPTTTSISLVTGWNLISFPSNSEGTLPAILSGLGTGYSLVYGYDSSLSSPWLLYDRTGATYANKLTKLTPGWGYWIKVGSNSTLVITY